MSGLRDVFVAEPGASPDGRALLGAVRWARGLDQAVAQLAKQGDDRPPPPMGAAETELLRALLGLVALSRKLTALDAGEAGPQAAAAQLPKDILR